MSPSQVIKPDPGTPPHGNSSRKRPRDSPDSLDQSSVHDTKKRMIRHPAAPPSRSPEAALTFGCSPISRSVEYNRDFNHLDITGPRGFHHIRRPRTSAPDRSSIIVEAVGGGKRGQSPYMKTWMANGFVTAQGLSIKNLDLWQEILQRLRDLQSLGSFVEFWLVPKAENQAARELATAGQSRRAAAEDMMASFRNAYGPFPTVKKEPK